MSDRASGNWLPYNLDGSMHDCKTGTGTGTKKVEAKPLTLDQIDVRLKRVEKVLFQNGST